MSNADRESRRRLRGSLRLATAPSPTRSPRRPATPTNRGPQPGSVRRRDETPRERHHRSSIEVETPQRRRSPLSNTPADLPDIDGPGGRQPVVQVRSEAAPTGPDLAGPLVLRRPVRLPARRRHRGPLPPRPAQHGDAGRVGHHPRRRYCPTPLANRGVRRLAHGRPPVGRHPPPDLPIDDARPVTIGCPDAAGRRDRQPDRRERRHRTDGDFTSAPILAVPHTKTGKVECRASCSTARNPIVDGIIFGDLMGAYAENIETDVVAALNGLAAGAIAGNVPIDLARQSPTPSSTPAPWSARNRKCPPNVLLLGGVLGRPHKIEGPRRPAAGRHRLPRPAERPRYWARPSSTATSPASSSASSRSRPGRADRDRMW